MKDQKGFGLVGILAVILVISIIATAGVGVYRNNSKQNQPVINQSHTESPSDDDSSESAEEAAFTEEFYDDVAKFSIKYPDGWTVSTEKSQQGPGELVANNKLTSPNGVVLRLNHNYGGKGGYCEPGTNDKPHQASNNCPTLEYLTKEAVGLSVRGGFDYKNSQYPVYLVTTKFTSAGGATNYTIALEAEYHDRKIEVNTPEVGAVMSLPHFPVYLQGGGLDRYIYAYASGESEAFLNGAEGQQVKDILKTFRIDQ